jgi:8-amino-7-oxononanoate synthase
MSIPTSILDKLQQRIKDNALRRLPKEKKNLIDFSSNDYLGFASNETIFSNTHQLLLDENFKKNGATGSRLISGNHSLYTTTENIIAKFHETESATIFNSGYDANLGFFSCVPQRNDIILYDELCHASIRDGLKMSLAKSYKFQHNNTVELEQLLQKFNSSASDNSIYVITESVFSMDGDTPNFEEITAICKKYHSYLVVDEAHSLGVFGEKGEGNIQANKLHQDVFARIITFGKGLGCHGAAIIGSKELQLYLVNFCRSLIYTTGLSPHSVATIQMAYKHLETANSALEKLKSNIIYFNQLKKNLGLGQLFVYSKSAIQCAIIPGNEMVKEIALQLQRNGFSVKPILSPTVPESQERLRICLHSFNTEDQIKSVLEQLANLIFNPKE